MPSACWTTPTASPRASQWTTASWPAIVPASAESRASVLFAFNHPSLDRFLKDVADGGLVIFDSSLIPDPPDLSRVEAIGLPATAIAGKAGSVKAAHLVALGAYLERTRILPESAIASALACKGMSSQVAALNLEALRAGMRFRSAP